MIKDRLNQQLDEISELIKRMLETKDVAGLLQSSYDSPQNDPSHELIKRASGYNPQHETLALEIAKMRAEEAEKMLHRAAERASIVFDYINVAHFKDDPGKKQNSVKISFTGGDPSDKLDVRMLDESGNVVWEAEDAVPLHGERNFVCGRDVKVFQLRGRSMNRHKSGVHKISYTSKINSGITVFPLR